MRRLFMLLICVALLVPAPFARATDLVLTPPVEGPLVRAFDPGPSPYSAGHRGVDLASPAGREVRAAADGVVHFSGTVAGRPSVSVDHGGGLRTTYTPVRGSLPAGTRVRSGQVIGHLQAGHCPRGCLHWGLTDGTRYFNPMHHVRNPGIRLLPADATPVPVEPLPEPPPPDQAPGRTGRHPVAGRVTSRFGMRVHPVTGVYKLHDGVDFAAPCGTPIRLTMPGTVTSAGYHGGYGYRVVVDHGDGVRTAYAHLPRIHVRVGQRLLAGEQVGVVGTTGYSTGCHLHWMGWRGGSLVNPLAAL